MPAVAGVPYRWQALIIVSLGTLTVHLDTTVNVALPAISAGLGAPISSIQWIIIGYVLTTASTLVAVGRLADLIGRRRIWNWGLLALAAALLLVSLAPTIELLVAARVLQAVGATMVYAAGPAIITDAFASRDRGRALGLMTMGGQVGMATGPLLGGWLLTTFDWSSIFWVRAPIALTIGLASWRLIHEHASQRARGQFDLGGAATLGLASLALLFGINRAGVMGWAEPLPLLLFGTGMALLVAFVWIEARVPAPMVDLALFRNRMFAAANAMNLLSNLTMFGVWLLVPYYLVDGLRLSPVMSGLFLSCVPTATALISPAAGWLSDRIGTRTPSLAGLVLQVLALLAISRLDAESAGWQVAGALVGLGVATGLFVAPNLSYIMGSVPVDQLGVAGGMVTTMRSLGVVTGVALLTTVYTTRAAEAGATATGLAAGAFSVPAFQAAFAFAALVCVAAVGLALVRGGPAGTVRSP